MVHTRIQDYRIGALFGAKGKPIRAKHTGLLPRGEIVGRALRQRQIDFNRGHPAVRAYPTLPGWRCSKRCWQRVNDLVALFQSNAIVEQSP